MFEFHYSKHAPSLELSVPMLVNDKIFIMFSENCWNQAIRQKYIF